MPLTCFPLHELPVDIFYQILLHISLPDYSQLSRTSKSIKAILNQDYSWRKLYSDRFGEENIPRNMEMDFYSLYKQKSILKRYMGKDFGIIHDNPPGRYWSIVQGDSECGQYAELLSVCWLHMEGSLSSVPRDEYQVNWRILVKRSAYLHQGIEFIATVEDEPGVLSKMVFTTNSVLPRDQWINIVSEEPLDLTKSKQKYQQVKFFVKAHGNNWKSGISFDYVKLVRKRRTEPASSSSMVETASNLVDSVVENAKLFLVSLF